MRFRKKDEMSDEYDFYKEEKRILEKLRRSKKKDIFIINILFIVTTIGFITSLFFVGNATLTGQTIGFSTGNSVFIVIVIALFILWAGIAFMKFQVMKIKREV